jgi:hypothetical protein
MTSKLLTSLMAATLMLSGVASAASLNATVEPMEGETLAQFQSSNFPAIDRREIRVSEGSGELNLKEAALLAQQERLAVHFVNDTDDAVQVNIPEINATFMVPAQTDRVYEFEANEVGYNQELSYTIVNLTGPDANYMAQNAELMRIANEEIIIPTFAQDTEVSNNTPAARPDYNTGSSVRGYW